MLSLKGIEVRNGNMATESHNLIADGMLESKHYGQGNNHHGKTYCHADGSNTNSRATHLLAFTLAIVYLSRDE